MNKVALLLALTAIGITRLTAQTFTQISTGTSFDHVQGKLIVADLDNDGDPDGVVSGIGDLSVYKYHTGTFTRNTFTEYGFNSGSYSVDAGDVDRNGFIDILHAGYRYEGFTSPSQHLLLNNGSELIPSADQILLEGGYRGDLVLGDFEGDGDLDVLAPGSNGVLLNRNNKIVDYGPYFSASGTWYANWWDLDHDGELEIVRTHGQPGSGGVDGTHILERHYPALSVSDALTFDAWYIYHSVAADYDSDGDFDILFQSVETTGNLTRIFRNDNGHFVDSGQSFPWGESVAFGDINNDGLYDVIIGGAMTSDWMVFETAVYLNQGNGSFTKLAGVIPSAERAQASVADFDNDGDLDILSLAGAFRNNSVPVNAAPLPPVSPTEIVSGSSVTFSWQPGSDDKSPINSLTYNISVRSEDGSIVVPSHALTNGKRQLYEIGNAWNNLSHTLSCLKAGKYYWKVQTLDAGYRGSSFSSERSFTIERAAPQPPQNVTATAFSDQGIDLHWTDMSEGEDEFIIFKKTPNDPSFFYAIDTVAANVTSYRDTINVYHNQTYIYRVVASSCAYPDEFAAESAPVTTFPRAFEETGWLPDNTTITMRLLGDYDRDGDLDLVVSDHLAAQTKLLRFTGVGYEDSGIHIAQTSLGGRWIDHNNDGYIDLLLYGGDVFNTTVTLYENDQGSTFTKVSTFTLPPNVKTQAGISPGDYDNDGDEDLLMQVDSRIHIYDNDGKGKFTRNTSIELTGHLKSPQAWADYDLDGDLDILANLEKSCTSNIIVIFENNADKSFKSVEFNGLEGTNDDFLNYTGDMAWGDYDNDGYPDIVVAGQNTCGNGFAINRIYHNEKNKTFTLKAELVKLTNDVDVEWGDYDNDGDLDVFAYGDPAAGGRARIYRNDGTRFVETNIDYLLQSRQYGKAAVGDIDNDGDLDYVMSGERDFVTQVSIVYKNTYAESWGRPNHKPSIPTSIQSVVNADQSVTLSWSRSTDDETTPVGLTYNLRVTNSDGLLICNSYTTGSGSLMLVTPGNVPMNSATLKNLESGSYSWSVQSIDKGFASSDFSDEKTFAIEGPPVVGIEDELAAGIRLYPNPVSDQLTISSGLSVGEVTISITNTLGQHIDDMRLLSDISFYDMKSLPSGIYLLSVHRNGSRISTKKIIKR